EFIRYKAANAGTYVHLIDPAYTTQDCFLCGYREKKDLWQRTHCCPVCGYTVPRDLNAAQNILKRAAVGWGTPESTLVEIRTATPPIPAVQVPVNETRISRL
ncbi:MAG: transposase, partial [Methanomicrobiaceae archaeon]|nr:transposase [Methanomicrobiaceae archaeon]